MSLTQSREHHRADGQPKVGISAERAKELAERKGMDAYECSVCGKWHVGHAPRRWHMREIRLLWRGESYSFKAGWSIKKERPS